MTTNLHVSKIGVWLKSTELFMRPSKKIPGKWSLYEYYVDSKNELLHYTSDKLKENNQSFTIIFLPDKTFSRTASLPISCIQNIEKGEWSISRNFITLIDKENFRNNVEFQFAFEKGNLKLLKRNKFGMLDFFGFLKPLK